MFIYNLFAFSKNGNHSCKWAVVGCGQVGVEVTAGGSPQSCAGQVSAGRKKLDTTKSEGSTKTHSEGVLLKSSSS